MRQPDYMFVSQMMFDDDFTAQVEALQMLAHYPLPWDSRTTTACYGISNCLRGNVAHTDQEHFWRVRCEAARALALW